jgi:hypothetical protein
MKQAAFTLICLALLAVSCGHAATTTTPATPQPTLTTATASDNVSDNATRTVTAHNP